MSSKKEKRDWNDFGMTGKNRISGSSRWMTPIFIVVVVIIIALAIYFIFFRSPDIISIMSFLKDNRFVMRPS